MCLTPQPTFNVASVIYQMSVQQLNLWTIVHKYFINYLSGRQTKLERFMVRRNSDEYHPKNFYMKNSKKRENGFAKFEKNGLYYFALYKGGDIVMLSQAYKSIAGRDNGVEAVKKNRNIIKRYRLDNRSGGKYGFGLFAGNGHEIAISADLKSRAEAERLVGRINNSSTTPKLAPSKTSRKIISPKRRRVAGIKKEPKRRGANHKNNYKRLAFYEKLTKGRKNGIESFKGTDGKHYFAHFENGKIRLISQSYPSPKTRDAGAALVKKNLNQGKRYDYSGPLKNGKYEYRLRAANGKELARSVWYGSAAGAATSAAYLIGSRKRTKPQSKIAKSAPKPRVSRVLKKTRVGTSKQTSKVSKAAPIIAGSAVAAAAVTKASKPKPKITKAVTKPKAAKAKPKPKVAKTAPKARKPKLETAKATPKPKTTKTAPKPKVAKVASKPKPKVTKAAPKPKTKPKSKPKAKVAKAAPIIAAAAIAPKASKPKTKVAKAAPKPKAAKAPPTPKAPKAASKPKIAKAAPIIAASAAAVTAAAAVPKVSKPKPKPPVPPKPEASKIASPKPVAPKPETPKVASPKPVAKPVVAKPVVAKPSAPKPVAPPLPPVAKPAAPIIAAASVEAAPVVAAKAATPIAATPVAAAGTARGGFGFLKWLLPLLLLLLLALFGLKNCQPTSPAPIIAPVLVSCWDGSEADTQAACPAKVTCWDGSNAINAAACPAEPAPKVTCWDGSLADSLSACPTEVAPEPEPIPEPEPEPVTEPVAAPEPVTTDAQFTSGTISRICGPSSNILFDVPNRSPKTLSYLGSNPQYGNSHGLTPAQFHAKLVSAHRAGGSDQAFLNLMARSLGYSHFQDMSAADFSNDTLANGSKGLLGVSRAHMLQYSRIQTTDPAHLEAFRVRSLNGTDVHIMKTCGNYMYVCN